MTPSRRQFVVSLALPLVVGMGCALRASTPHPKGLLEGYVFRRYGLVGRSDMRVPATPVMVSRWLGSSDEPWAEWKLTVIAKARTDHIGHYRFELPPGWYYVQAVGGPWKIKDVHPDRPVWVNLFQHYGGH